MEEILVVGCGGAGFYAAFQAVRVNPSAKVTIIEKREYDIYRPCGLPFAIEGVIDSLDRLVAYVETRMIRVERSTQALRIDPQSRTIEVKSLKTGEKRILNYDKLILCTGGYPFIPPIPGRDKSGVFTLRTVEDAKTILEYIKKAKVGVLVGAGPINVEVATALHRRGIKIHIVEILPSLLPLALDKDMASIIEEKFREAGVHIHTGKGVKEIKGEDKVQEVIINEETFNADFVIMATGVRPEVTLAKDAKLKLGETGGIWVNQAMKTSDENIYAAGDCVETIHLITQRPILPLLASVAMQQGKTAGANAAGGHMVYTGTLNTFITTALDLEIAGTGITENMAKRFGIDVVTAKVTGTIKAPYYPNPGEFTVKLLARAYDGKLVGAQIVGEKGSAVKIGVLSLAIREGLTVDDLSSVELGYAPPVSDVADPIIEAANISAGLLLRKRVEEEIKRRRRL